MTLIEIREGYYLNLDQIVSVKVLTQAEGLKFAVMQLSNGESQNITREEFDAIVGEAPRLARRL